MHIPLRTVVPLRARPLALLGPRRSSGIIYRLAPLCGELPDKQGSHSSYPGAGTYSVGQAGRSVVAALAISDPGMGVYASTSRCTGPALHTVCALSHLLPRPGTAGETSERREEPTAHLPSCPDNLISFRMHLPKTPPPQRARLAGILGPGPSYALALVQVSLGSSKLKLAWTCTMI